MVGIWPSWDKSFESIQVWLGYRILVCVPWVGVLILLCVPVGRVGKCFLVIVSLFYVLQYLELRSPLCYRSDNHCLGGFEVRSRGLLTLNLWGTCWLLPIYAGFVSLWCSAIVETRGPGWWFAFSRPEDNVWVYADSGLIIMSSCLVFCAIAKDSSFGAKSAFGLNWDLL